MANVRGISRYQLELGQPKDAPFKGAAGPGIDAVVSVAPGTSANQADLMGGTTFTIAASGNADKSLVADFLDANEDALSTAVELVEFYCKVTGNAAGVLNISPSASNGFTGLIDGTTDNIVLKNGSEFIVRNYTAVGVAAISGTNKSLNFANADASNAATITCWAICRSA
jgi:hypothetical protein